MSIQESIDQLTMMERQLINANDYVKDEKAMALTLAINIIEAWEGLERYLEEQSMDEYKYDQYMNGWNDALDRVQDYIDAREQEIEK